MSSFSAALAIILLIARVDAFVIPGSQHGTAQQQRNNVAAVRSLFPLASNNNEEGSITRLFAETPTVTTTNSDDKYAEIDKLKVMAAKLRAEAASLEAEKAKELATAAESAFRKFDVNQDGEISLDELRAGLEKTFKMEVSASRVEELMKAFDTSGDGALQLDEFVGVDRFRNQLESLARDEKEAARQAQLAAKKEEEIAAFTEAKANILNDGPPSTSDRLVSVLPYLLPLMDGLQFGRFLLPAGGESDSAALYIVALVYSLYRSIPFGGFIAFIATNILSDIPNVNRLVRFNARQAIFLDIALFFPGVLSAIYTLIQQSSAFGGNLPTSPTEIGSDAVFVALVASVAYCAISSLLGFTPDKIPFISKSVNDRMLTIDMFDDMFDQDGKFVSPKLPQDEEKDKKKDE